MAVVPAVAQVAEVVEVVEVVVAQAASPQAAAQEVASLAVDCSDHAAAAGVVDLAVAVAEVVGAMSWAAAVEAAGWPHHAVGEYGVARDHGTRRRAVLQCSNRRRRSYRGAPRGPTQNDRPHAIDKCAARRRRGDIRPGFRADSARTRALHRDDEHYPRRNRPGDENHRALGARRLRTASVDKRVESQRTRQPNSTAARAPKRLHPCSIDNSVASAPLPNLRHSARPGEILRKSRCDLSETPPPKRRVLLAPNEAQPTPRRVDWLLVRWRPNQTPADIGRRTLRC